MKTKRGIYLLLFSILVVLAISLVSAGFFDKFRTITGRAEQQPQDLTITVVGTNPVVFSFIEDPDDQVPPPAPVEAGISTITFEVHVTDPDGVTDIIDSTVDTEFSRGAVIRPGICTWIEDLPDGDTANYSCSVDMQYYDEPGTWNIKVNATDYGSGVWVEDTSVTFTYLELKAMTISPSTLTWPAVIPGSINQTSDNDPTVITNTGNFAGNIQVTALALIGESAPAESIPAADFVIDVDTGGPGCTDAACVECDGTQMVESTATPIVGSSSNPGPGGTEEIYHCIPFFPSVSSQTYSTAGGGSWTILY